MFRGDFGVLGIVLFTSACSSRVGVSLPQAVATRGDDPLTNDASAEVDAATDEQGGRSSSAAEAESRAIDRDRTDAPAATTERGNDVDVGAPAVGDGAASTPDAAGVEDWFQVSAHLANDEDPAAPTTVGIVTWSTKAGRPSAAKVEFGLTTEYGTQAPVDLTSPKLRTVLVGMKPARTYHYRICASIDGREWVSGDSTLTTGPAPALDVVSIASYDVRVASAHEAGFIVASHWNGTYQGMVFILDPDGEIVWWYRSGLKGGVAKAEISADGRDVWMVSAANNDGEKLARVGLDGLRPQYYSNIGASHDIVATVGDVMAVIDYSADDTVLEIDRSGIRKQLFASSAFPERGPAPHHLNAIDFDEVTNRYVVSSLDTDVYLFPRRGSTIGDTQLLTQVVGANSVWGGYQHGVELLSNNHLLIFANQKSGEQGSSSVIEYDLTDGAEVWRYQSDESTANFGDVQRLPRGNTLITYSNAGVMVEVTPERETVFELTTSLYLGYATWRQRLYPPLEAGPDD